MTPLVPSVSALRISCLAALAAITLGGCVTDSKPASELPASVQTAARPDGKPDDAAKNAAAKDDKGKADNKPGARPDTKPKPAAAAAPEDPGPPLERHEVAGTCWMIADKRGGSMDAKIKMVDQCIDERMKADAIKRAGPAAH
jgi:hypothetical protein